MLRIRLIMLRIRVIKDAERLVIVFEGSGHVNPPLQTLYIL